MSGITRRKVLAGAAAAGLVGAAPAFAAGVTEKYDVVVVGSGSAGFAAAIRAAEAGSSVILLEVNTWFGGASRVATGIFGCAGHPIQKALGFKTTPEDLYQLYIGEAAATHTVGEPDVARILADGAIPAADWLESLGVRWSRKKAQKFFLNIGEGVRLGQVLIPALEAKAKSLGVAMRTRTRATELITSGGRVTGVICKTPKGVTRYAAKAVILATGGFEGNPHMIAKYIGDGWDMAGFYCTPADRGDGQRMGEAAGAELADMDVFKANPTIHRFEGNKYNMRPAVNAGAIIVNQDGVRFMNETGGYWEARKIWALPQKQAWVVFGDPVLAADKRLPGLIAAGSIVKAVDAAALEMKTGINGKALADTIAAYTKLAETGKDPDFGRANVKPAFGGSLYAAPISPMIQGTFGGVKTNAQTEALRPDGSVIPGLYAVGECAASGLRGLNPQTANAVFGSIAGRQAAAWAKTAL